MPLKLEIIRAAEFVRVGPQGHFDLAASKKALASVAAACRKRGIQHAVIDLRALHPGPKPVFSPADLHELVTTFHKVGFTHRLRLAVLYHTDPHKRARLFAFLSTMHGWSVRAFSDFEQALLWLSDTKEPTSKRKRAPGEKAVPVQFLQGRQTSRRRRLRNTALAVLLPTALILMASCASKRSEPVLKTQTFQSPAGSAGFGGGTFSTSVTTTSTVVSVNPARHTLELKQAGGSVTTYQAGPEVAHFDQIKTGDRVTTTLAVDRTIGFAVTGARLSDSDKTNVVHSPNGGPIIAVNTRRLTAKVLAVNYWLHSVTLQTADGKTMTAKANENTNLAVVNPGDEVSVLISEARTFSVVKPQAERRPKENPKT